MTQKGYRPGWRAASSRGGSGIKSGWFVSRLKVILPLTIIVILALIFAWPKIVKLFADHNEPKTIERILKENPLLEDKVINPKLSSLDNKGRPFLIEAQYATHLNDPVSQFIQPSGNLKLEDGSTMSFKGGRGTYYKEKEMLEVFENVSVKTDKGYDLKTDYMKLFPKDNIGEGDKPVHGLGPGGETITAEGFKITNKGDIIEFLGKTQITLPGK